MEAICSNSLMPCFLEPCKRWADGEWLWMNRAIVDVSVLSRPHDLQPPSAVTGMLSRASIYQPTYSTHCHSWQRRLSSTMGRVGMIARCASSQSDVCCLSLVQRSWISVVQTELFGYVCISTALQSQQFVRAFISTVIPEILVPRVCGGSKFRKRK